MCDLLLLFIWILFYNSDLYLLIGYHMLDLHILLWPHKDYYIRVNVSRLNATWIVKLKLLKVKSHYSLGHQRMCAYAQMLAYAGIRKGFDGHTSSTFQIQWNTSVYVVLYTEANILWDMFKIYQRMRAYSICVTHYLTLS